MGINSARKQCKYWRDLARVWQENDELHKNLIKRDMVSDALSGFLEAVKCPSAKAELKCQKSNLT